MAKVANPFMSQAASGTAGSLTAIDNALHRAHVEWAQQEQTRRRRGQGTTLNQIMRFHRKIAKISSPRRKRAPSAAQLARREKLQQCAAAWRTLPPTEKTAWNARRLTVYKASSIGFTFTVTHGYALFVRQWMEQAILPPNIPRLPA